MKRVMIISLFIGTIAFAQSDPNNMTFESCTGYYAPTGLSVFGKCVDGKFEGYYAPTGKSVYGTCDKNGKFKGYYAETGLSVYGKCEKEER